MNKKKSLTKKATVANALELKGIYLSGPRKVNTCRKTWGINSGTNRMGAMDFLANSGPVRSMHIRYISPVIAIRMAGTDVGQEGQDSPVRNKIEKDATDTAKHAAYMDAAASGSE